MRVQDDLLPSDRTHKETADPDRFQPSDSEVQDSRGGRRIRELLVLIEQLSWRTYLKDKTRQNR
jgi:hypothetical protein